MARAIWNFRLVSIPVKLFTAIRANAVLLVLEAFVHPKKRTVTRTSRTNPTIHVGPARSRGGYGALAVGTF